MNKTKNEQTIIYCPKCGRKVMKHDGKGTIPISVMCKNCRKIIVYNPETKKITIKKKTQNYSASGKRFY